MEIILGVFINGARWRKLWQESLALGGIGVVLFGLPLLAFRRRIVRIGGNKVIRVGT
ncbi:MAG TPA: hypothetical protein VGC50_17135 [Gammaproteobacteria bacterium]|jgi:hypothetical protein